MWESLHNLHNNVLKSLHHVFIIILSSKAQVVLHLLWSHQSCEFNLCNNNNKKTRKLFMNKAVFQSHVFREQNCENWHKIEKEMKVVSTGEETVAVLFNVINELWFKATDKMLQWGSWGNYLVTWLPVSKSHNIFDLHLKMYAEKTLIHILEVLFASWYFHLTILMRLSNLHIMLIYGWKPWGIFSPVLSSARWKLQVWSFKVTSQDELHAEV